VRPTPEQIEARRFRLAQNGYDCESVDRFLAEVAEGLRDEPAPELPSTDEFGRLGQEIAGILRNARDSAGAVKAEAEGQAAAVRSRAEVEAAEVHKAAEAEANELRAEAEAMVGQARAEAETEVGQARTRANDEAEAIRAAARADAAALRQAAEAEAAEIRVAAERQLEQAAQALARASDEAAARRAVVDEEARRRSAELLADATRRASEAQEAEQGSYLRLLAARDDLQAALDRLLADLDLSAEAGDPIVDLTVAPPHVRPLTRPEPISAPHAPTAGEADDAGLERSGEVALDLDRSTIGSADLDAASGPAAADPLLRMVRAAVGRAAEASSADPSDREASAS
jgi:DivIVA domain-containing protein